MVDFFLLIMIAGAGDELQGMKKGVIEIADLLAVNKADGDNIARANLACAESNRALNFLQPATPGWKTRCVTCSALVPETLAALWKIIGQFAAETRVSGTLEKRRRHQSIEWMRAMIEEELHHRFFRNERVRKLLPEIEKQVAAQTLPAATAVKRIMESFNSDNTTLP
jgi:LAO/AO transport system kinase